jgi:transcriptional regulator GlxA family with amidase domain
VPGRHDVSAETPAHVITALRSAYAAGTRIASICSGAFTPAAAGLLDGKRATTHWIAAEEFRAAFPTAP